LFVTYQRTRVISKHLTDNEVLGKVLEDGLLNMGRHV
jgi:hypothetical protein